MANNVEIHDGTPIIRIIGDLDHFCQPEFRSVMARLVEEDHRALIFDLTKVDFLDSGGLTGIVFAIKRFSQIGGRLFLANCNPRITRKLEISGLTKLGETLVISPSVEASLLQLLSANDRRDD